MEIQQKLRTEYFHFQGQTWDIRLAKKLITQSDYTVFQIDRLTIPFTNPPLLNEEHVDSVNLDDPLLFAKYYDNDGKDLGYLFVDGYHRVNKAKRKGVRYLRCIYLTPEHSKQIVKNDTN